MAGFQREGCKRLPENMATHRFGESYRLVMPVTAKMASARNLKEGTLQENNKRGLTEEAS